MLDMTAKMQKVASGDVNFLQFFTTGPVIAWKNIPYFIPLMNQYPDKPSLWKTRKIQRKARLVAVEQIVAVLKRGRHTGR